jgi:hypothetical protein
MSTKLSSTPNKKTWSTTVRLPDVGKSAKRVSHNALIRLFHHLNRPTNTDSARPSEAQRQLIVTGFILGVVSILTSIFPICGLPTSIAGLLIGVYGRRKTRALHTMSSWAIALSLAGLALSLLYIIVTMALYVNRQLLS